MVRAVRFSDRYIDAPIRKGVLLERRFPHGPGHRSVQHTNVPHLVGTHGLPGYEWGYKGSGPLDLALNIAEFAVRQLELGSDPVPLYWGSCYHESGPAARELLERVVARVPRQGRLIPWEDIAAIVRRAAATAGPANDPHYYRWRYHDALLAQDLGHGSPGHP